jgi:hypothetical protein
VDALLWAMALVLTEALAQSHGRVVPFCWVKGVASTHRQQQELTTMEALQQVPSLLLCPLTLKGPPPCERDFKLSFNPTSLLRLLFSLLFASTLMSITGAAMLPLLSWLLYF